MMVGVMMGAALAPAPEDALGMPADGTYGQDHPRVGSSSSSERLSSRQKSGPSEPANIDPNIDTQAVSLKIVALVKPLLTEDERQYFSKLIKLIQSLPGMPSLAEHISKSMDTESDLYRSIAFCLVHMKVDLFSEKIRVVDLLIKQRNIGFLHERLLFFLYNEEQIKYYTMCRIQQLFYYLHSNEKIVKSLLNQQRGAQKVIPTEELSILERIITEIDPNISGQGLSIWLAMMNKLEFDHLRKLHREIMEKQQKAIRCLCAYAKGCDVENIEKMLFPDNPYPCRRAPKDLCAI